MEFGQDMFDPDEFYRRFQKFKKIDYANSFYSFWKYKVNVEAGAGHILDSTHMRRTVSKLGPILRAWQAYRPFDSSVCLERLETSLGEMVSEYDLIRNISLLEFDKAPRNVLKTIWHKLGRVKEYDGKENSYSRYYVMATTKQLMFLWGQTLAFDELVRDKMPPSDYTYVRMRARNNKWTFTMWHNVMSEFQERVLEMPEFIDLCHTVCLKEFGNDEIIPYGQFIDLYYWIGAKK